MKKRIFGILSLLIPIAATIGSMSVHSPSAVFYHQPKIPREMLK